MSTSSSVSSHSSRSGASRHTPHGQCHREPGGHMKINLPVFKDEDRKDTVTYQSWHWDKMVYHWAGCQYHTLLPYIICSLQVYPGELVRSSGTDITLDGVLTMLDEHYNNGWERDGIWVGVHLSRHLKILMASFLECFPPDHIAKLKCEHFYGRLPKWFKVMVAYLKVSANEKTYSEYLWAAWEAKKEEAMEASHNPAMASKVSPEWWASFPCGSSKAVSQQ